MTRRTVLLATAAVTSAIPTGCTQLFSDEPLVFEATPAASSDCSRKNITDRAGDGSNEPA